MMRGQPGFGGRGGPEPGLRDRIRSAGDLPFVERPVAELLGIVTGRVAIDEDFEAFGWARLPEL